jgi:hypothetical protein
VAAIDKTSGHYVAFGAQAVLPDVRANSTLAHPLRSPKISNVCFCFVLEQKQFRSHPPNDAIKF